MEHWLGHCSHPEMRAGTAGQGGLEGRNSCASGKLEGLRDGKEWCWAGMRDHDQTRF